MLVQNQQLKKIHIVSVSISILAYKIVEKPQTILLDTYEYIVPTFTHQTLKRVSNF